MRTGGLKLAALERDGSHGSLLETESLEGEGEGGVRSGEDEQDTGEGEQDTGERAEDAEEVFWGRDADAEGGGGGVEDAEEAATQRLLLRFGFEWRVVALCCGKAELAQDQDEAYGKDGKEGRVRRCKWRDWPHFIFREAQP